MRRRSAAGCAGLVLLVGLALACRREDPPAAPVPEPAEPEPSEPEPEPAEPECDGEPCPAPRECIQYFGIAGPSGPSFHACEIRCERGASPERCPEGMRCTTIADGPGDVCR